MSPTQAEMTALREVLKDEYLRERKATRGFVADIVGLSYAYAGLSVPGDTSCILADTYYPLVGTFVNDPMVGFSVDVDHIVYDRDDTRVFEIDWHATLEVNANGRKIHIGLAINGVVTHESTMCAYCKYSAEPVSFSGTKVVELKKDDEIQIMVSSDGAGDVVTTRHFTTSIRAMPGAMPC